MKGTFFSADFVRDESDNLRLIEINTDTGIVDNQKHIFDWTDFINVLQTNNITEVDVMYKYSVQAPIVETLSASLASSASFITQYNQILIDENNIFPTTPTDSDNKFILRMVYDELAILDSEYAKGTLGLLKLFADNNDTSSIINFAHSSSIHGEYNTLDTTLSNPSNVPDFISKTIVEEHTAHEMYKLGLSNSGLSTADRVNNFFVEKTPSDIVIEQYHYSPTAVSENTNHVTSIRSFQIVYGANLDICYNAQYEIPAVFELPTSITAEVDDSILINNLSKKHYYEFATNHVKNLRHGFLGDTEILDSEGNEIQIQDAVLGNTYKSYFIEGAPDTDDYATLQLWSYSGSTLPSGSYITSSILVGANAVDTYTTEMTIMTLSDDDSQQVILGGETRMLVYDSDADVIWYERVLDIAQDDYLITSTGGLVQVKKMETVIFEEKQQAHTLNLEDVDNFILKIENIHGFSIGVFFAVAHNCFIAGTQISMADGSVKNIEDIVDGDVVLSLNETGLNIEPKTISNIRVFDETNFITIKLENGKEIVSTLDHPYYTAGPKLKSYNGTTTNGEKLQVGDSFFLLNSKEGEMVKIESITEHNDSKPVYIFSVEGNHNFYANEILVHNK